uniref:Artemin n=1 Tax=Otus sunia TaxID=257818 RepID=A0A8C8B9U5_9STRI
MEQRAGPPEPRPAGPTTHPQPKVSPGLPGRDGRVPHVPIPSLWSLVLVWGPRLGLTPLCCALLQEGTLWGLLAILSLLAGLAAGTLGTPHCNETLDASPTLRGMATASPAVEVPPAAARSPLYGDNVTTGGLGAAELAEELLLRAERSPPSHSKHKHALKHSQRPRGRNCHIRNLMVKVRDLGLGFNSDEIVLFKYCSGSCHRARSNYDLTLGSLLRQQLITPGPQERVLSHPCCRPTRYEAVSFMDVQNTWQTVEKLSAAECSCIG